MPTPSGGRLWVRCYIVSLVDKCHLRPLGFGLPSVLVGRRAVMCWVLFPGELGEGRR